MADFIEDYDYAETNHNTNQTPNFHLSAVAALGFFTGSLVLSNPDGHSENSFQNYLFEFSGILLIGCVMVFYSWYKMKSKTGIFPNFYHSTLVKPIWNPCKSEKIKFKIAPGVLKCILSAVSLFFAGGISTFVLTFDNDYLKNGLNESMFCLASFLVIIVTYHLFRTSYTFAQIAGISLTSVSSIWFFMTLEKDENLIMFFLDILEIGFLVLGVTLLIMASLKDLDFHTAGIIQLLIQGILGVLLLVVLYVSVFESATTLHELLLSLISGCLLGMGLYCLTISLMTQNPGISISIMLLKEVIYAFIILPSYDISSIFPFSLCSLGLFMMIFGDSLLNKIKCNHRLLKSRSPLLTPLIEYNL